MIIFTKESLWLGNVVSISKSEAAQMYWDTDIPASEIIETYATGLHPNQIMTVAGQAYSPFVCESCECPVTVKSRSDAQQLFSFERRAARNSSRRDKHPHQVICRECRQRMNDRAMAGLRREQNARNERRRYLRSMPYRDYLKTPEWSAKRSDAMRRSRYRCQTCASGGELHVHHRTYVRRGDDRASDLSVLCADCHRVFHEHRSLADQGRSDF